MKFLLTFAIIIATVSASPSKINILSTDFIDSINRQQSSWIAGRNFPENTTHQHLYELAGTLGFHPDPNFKPEVKVHQLSLEAIPDTFDARTRWPHCESLNRIRDQGACGSCWAFAAVEVMSDRLCIHSSGSQQFWFSPQDVLTCCEGCGTCVGGWQFSAFEYYVNSGVVSGGDLNSNEGCSPYAADAHDHGQTPSCSPTCVNSYSVGYDQDKHFGSSDYVIDNSIDQIQTEIMNNGPITVMFELFQDFYSYTSGVYYHVTGESVGYHVVKVIGWGTENGTPYWLVANSWGSGFGDNGFFKMRRGTNECGIENNPAAVLPKL